MTRQITRPTGTARFDDRIDMRSPAHSTAHSSGAAYQRHIAAPRALFAVPPIDLTALVIAEAIKRKAQAELQREALRDSVYEMPVSRDKNYDRDADVHPSDADE
jgi:hypothetical protein